MLRFLADNWQWIVPTSALALTIVGWFVAPLIAGKLASGSARRGAYQMAHKRNIMKGVRGGKGGDSPHGGVGGRGGNAYGIYMDEESSKTAVNVGNVFEDIAGGSGGSGRTGGRGGEAAGIKIGKRKRRSSKRA